MRWLPEWRVTCPPRGQQRENRTRASVGPVQAIAVALPLAETIWGWGTFAYRAGAAAPSWNLRAPGSHAIWQCGTYCQKCQRKAAGLPPAATATSL